MKKFTKKEVFLIGFLSILLFTAFAFQTRVNYAQFNYGIRISQTPGIKAGAFIEHETDSVLNFATSHTRIGNLRPTGVTMTTYIPARADTGLTTGLGLLKAAFFTQWITAADSDNGIRWNGDGILDSVSYFATPGSSTDSLVSAIYITTSNATLVIAIDTLIFASAGWQTTDLTGVTDATRDFNISADEYPAFRATELGTLSTVGLLIHWRAYDVQ